MGRNVRRGRTNFVAANGSGPWLCWYCHQLVYELKRGDGVIHHVDENFENDDASNLQVMHDGCHQKHHHKGVPKTPEHRTKTGRKGRVFTPEWKAKLSAKQLTRVTCPTPGCGYTNSPQYVGKHRKASCH